jgi:hypothetical protein
MAPAQRSGPKSRRPPDPSARTERRASTIRLRHAPRGVPGRERSPVSGPGAIGPDPKGRPVPRSHARRLPARRVRRAPLHGSGRCRTAQAGVEPTGGPGRANPELARLGHSAFAGKGPPYGDSVQFGDSCGPQASREGGPAARQEEEGHHPLFKAGDGGDRCGPRESGGPTPLPAPPVRGSRPSDQGRFIH